MKKFEEINSNTFGILNQSEITNLNLILGGTNSEQGCGTSTQTDGVTHTAAQYTDNGKIWARESETDNKGDWANVRPENQKICPDTIS